MSKAGLPDEVRRYDDAAVGRAIDAALSLLPEGHRVAVVATAEGSGATRRTKAQRAVDAEWEALRLAVEAEREACARVAEQHLDHIDTDPLAPPRGLPPQDHIEPPYRCNVAEAIRARGQR